MNLEIAVVNPDLYQESIDYLVDYFSKSEFFKEICSAKSEYFKLFGNINDDDPEFENKMDLFLGWYLFDRQLSGYDISPVHLFFRRNLEEFLPERRVYFQKLAQAVHSVFQIIKEKGDILYIRDLGTKTKYSIRDYRFQSGFSTNDVFEARIVPVEKGHCFIRGFCFHPQEASSFIAKQMKKVRADDENQRTKLLMQFSSMRLKHQRFPHIDLKYIYSLSPKI